MWVMYYSPCPLRVLNVELCSLSWHSLLSRCQLGVCGAGVKGYHLPPYLVVWLCVGVNGGVVVYWSPPYLVV